MKYTAHHRPWFALCAVLAVSVLAVASAATAPLLHVEGAWVRLLPGTLPAAGYFTLVNDTGHSKVLVGVDSPSWKSAMLHRSVGAEGQSTMTMVDSVTVPAHGRIQFAPGNYHIMLSEAQTTLVAGGHATITLHFSDGTKLPVKFALRPADATGP